jgi:hypothetical protein
MTDELKTTTPPTAGGEGEKGSEAPAHSQVPETIPYSRFTEVNNDNKALQAKLKEIQDAQTAAAEAAAKEKGEFEKLYNENLPKIKGYDELNQTLDSMLKTTIDGIPEEKRKLIPTEYPPHKQLAWINANRDILVGEVNKNAPITPSGASGGKRMHKLSDIRNAKYYAEHQADILLAGKENRIVNDA